jgi:hypothetical protein
VWCSASKKRKARGYDVRGSPSPSPSKKSRPCDAADIEKSDSASSDESEDGVSDKEAEEDGEFIPDAEGTDAQDDSSEESYDPNDEALVEETQQYSLYVGYWEDISHVVDFQVRSKSSIE